MRRAVVVCAKRSPIGNFGGVFKDISAIELGVHTLKAIIRETGVSPEAIDEVIVGNVCGAGLGQNVARQISIHAGIPDHVPAYTINKVCGSGMKAVALAALMIKAGEAEIVVAGGTENMSQIPYILKDARWGARMGDKSLVDLMIRDGLSDIFNDYHMGLTAENLVDKFSLSREEQDAFAAASQNKTEAAQDSDRFKDEIVPISIPQRKGDPIVVNRDEMPRAGVTADSLAKVRPAFKKEGSVTAANSSGINDGAALLMIMSEEKANELGLTPLAYFVDSASAGVDPAIMGYGPVHAIKNVLTKSIGNTNTRNIVKATLNALEQLRSRDKIASLRGVEL